MSGRFRFTVPRLAGRNVSVSATASEVRIDLAANVRKQALILNTPVILFQRKHVPKFQ
jgi:hypothetical protein